MSAIVKIFHQKCRELRSKTTEFYLNLRSSDSDMVCLTEKWLNERVYTYEILIIDDKYSNMTEVIVFRRKVRGEVTLLPPEKLTKYESEGLIITSGRCLEIISNQSWPKDL